MQKIIVENFGPITRAEVDIKKIVVLIGEQASGKSTIAKLIYFFKSLSDESFLRFYKSNRTNFDKIEDLVFAARDRFYALFGSTMHLPNFQITFFYNHSANKSIGLKLDEKRRLIVALSNHFQERGFVRTLEDKKRQIQAIEERLGVTRIDPREEVALNADKTAAIQDISTEFNRMFETDQQRHFYTIAGRESMVSYQTTFESYLENSIQNYVETNRKRSEETFVQAVDEILMLDFIKEVRRVKEVFLRNGGSFSSLQNNLRHRDRQASRRRNSTDSIESQSIQLFLERLAIILKGKYEIDGFGEKLRHSETSYTNLKDASSGQKESIRILQIIFLAILENQKGFQVIEEPEAHLFPIAQKALVELLVLMANHMESSQLIITTHSPYILTVINNLLFSSRVIQRNESVTEQVGEIVPSPIRINPDLFSAYSFGNSFYPESSSCESIFEEQTGQIRQNYLDIVSEMLGADFNRLYRLHAQSFAPRPA